MVIVVGHIILIMVWVDTILLVSIKVAIKKTCFTSHHINVLKHGLHLIQIKDCVVIVAGMYVFNILA